MGDAIAEVRAFNRFYTRTIGLLDSKMMDTPYTLTEARVLFELAQADEVEVSAMRSDLGLDAGYLSRIVARFEAAGILNRSRSPEDARRGILRITAAGRAVFGDLDARSARKIGALLDPLTEDGRAALVQAMTAIRRILDPRPATPLDLRPPRAGELGWVIERHGALYAREYGWDRSFEALVARIVSDFAAAHDPEREAAWIAALDGAPVGCVFCVQRTPETAQLRCLLVEPTARGRGVGTRLISECTSFARKAGYADLVLWTNHLLVDARRLYERSGFALIAEQPSHDFGQDVVEQTWRLAL